MNRLSGGAAAYENPRTGVRWPIDRPLTYAPDDGGYLNLSPGSGPERIEAARLGLWRYSSAIRLPNPDAVVSLGEGLTPLVDVLWDDRPIKVKCEQFAPTGSFKDRGSVVLLNYLKQCGVETFVEDTSGNTGASLATYAAALGLAARIVMPDTAPLAKRLHPRFVGADVIEVAGGREAASERARREGQTALYVGHNWQPFFLEGVKTVAFELWEQSGGRLPDAIVTPVGQGNLLMGLALGFGELLRSGAISSRPRLIGVQPSACGPYAAAFANGGVVPAGRRTMPTIADGAASERPVRLTEVLSAASETGGALLGVSEAEILDAWRALGRIGLFLEPTSALGFAGLRRLWRAGDVGLEDRVVVMATGSGLKAIDVIADRLRTSSV